MAGQDGKPLVAMEGIRQDTGEPLHQEEGTVIAPRDNMQGSGEHVWAMEVYKGDKPIEEELEVEDDGIIELELDEDEAEQETKFLAIAVYYSRKSCNPKIMF
jgi:hypothetical protein